MGSNKDVHAEAKTKGLLGYNGGLILLIIFQRSKFWKEYTVHVLLCTALPPFAGKQALIRCHSDSSLCSFRVKGSVDCSRLQELKCALRSPTRTVRPGSQGHTVRHDWLCVPDFEPQSFSQALRLTVGKKKHLSCAPVIQCSNKNKIIKLWE